jgi:hypothetical protein
LELPEGECSVKFAIIGPTDGIAPDDAMWQNSVIGPLPPKEYLFEGETRFPIESGKDNELKIEIPDTAADRLRNL